MIIPMNVDRELDAKLIDWLKKKRNSSAFMREVLYKEMEKESNGQSVNANTTSTSRPSKHTEDLDVTENLDLASNTRSNTEQSTESVTEEQPDEIASELVGNFVTSLGTFGL